MIRYSEVAINGEIIELKANMQSCLGPNAIFSQCHITLPKSAKNLIVTESTFENCSFVSPNSFVNFQGWCNAKLAHCKFIGQFVGNDFGNWPDIKSKGTISDCDFTDALLDGCRFMSCSPSRIVFPLWPCFTIMQPTKRAGEFANIRMPGKLGIWADGLSWSPECVVAETNYAPKIAKQFSTTIDDIKLILQQLNNVVF